MATANQETRTITDVVLRMDPEEAIAMYALASRAEELPTSHPLRVPASKVFTALSETLGTVSFEARQTAYRSIDVRDDR